MKPKHIKQQRKQEVRLIHKRIWEIRKEIRNLGYIKLEKPIRHGWFKEIVITQNIERYKSKIYILELYNVIEKQFWGRTKEEASNSWFKETSKHLIYKDFPTISKKQFNKLSDKAQKMCTVFQYRDDKKKLKTRFYIKIPKSAYKIKYSRAYITHSKRIDPLLQSESDLLWQQLNKNGYYNIAHYNYWKDRWQTSEQRKEKLEAKRKLNALRKYPLSDIINDNILWEKN